MKLHSRVTARIPLLLSLPALLPLTARAQEAQEIQEAQATQAAVANTSTNTNTDTTPQAEATLDTIAVPASAPSPDAPVPAAEGPAQNRLLEEIIVTARKREEKLQDVPVSVSAFSSDQLDAHGVVDVRDLGQAVPGLQFTDLAGYNLIYLRGIGTDAFIPSADPSVATYLDGVYFPSAHSMAQSFGALDRVEVLKGPQGTLFGRNSTGGAVMLWTKDPGQEIETSVQASYARFHDSKTRIYTSIPLNETLGLSLSGFYNHADNYYRLDDASGKDLPPEVNRGARIKLGIYPADNLSIVLTGMLMQQSGTSTTTSANTIPSPLLGASIPPETRDYVVTANSTPSLTTDTRAVYGKINWSNPGIDTKLLSSYYYVNAHDYVYDFDGSAQPIATYGADSDYQRIVTSELQFTSNAESWGASWLKWVGGIYYLHSRGGYNPGYLRLLDTVRLPINDIVGSLPPSLQQVIRGPLGDLPIPSQLTFYFTGLVGAESYSAYAQTTASLTDWLDLTLGGRYQRETRKLLQSDVGLGSLNGDPATVLPWPHEESTVHNFSPKASLDFRPLQDVLLYASVQQGFKSATYNIINIYTPPDYVKPEKVRSYELGLKSELIDHRLRFNAALFQNDIRNLQTGFVSFTSGGAINFENAGSARIRGAEFDLLLQPLREWDPGLVFTAGGTWLDSEYTDYQNGSGYQEGTGLAYRDNFSGNRIVRTPKFSGTLGFSQRFDVPGGELEFGADWYHNSGYYYLAQNSDSSFEDAYDIIGARISYLIRDWGLRLTLFGENLGDERYDLAQFHTDFGREDTLAPPVSYGLRLNWDF